MANPIPLKPVTPQQHAENKAQVQRLRTSGGATIPSGGRFPIVSSPGGNGFSPSGNWTHEQTQSFRNFKSNAGNLAGIGTSPGAVKPYVPPISQTMQHSVITPPPAGPKYENPSPMTSATGPVSMPAGYLPGTGPSVGTQLPVARQQTPTSGLYQHGFAEPGSVQEPSFNLRQSGKGPVSLEDLPPVPPNVWATPEWENGYEKPVQTPQSHTPMLPMNVTPNQPRLPPRGSNRRNVPVSPVQGPPSPNMPLPRLDVSLDGSGIPQGNGGGGPAVPGEGTVLRDNPPIPTTRGPIAGQRYAPVNGLKTSGGVQLDNSIVAKAATTPYSQWTPEMHAAMWKNSTPEHAAAMHTVREQAKARENLLARNTGEFGAGGVGVGLNSQGRMPQTASNETAVSGAMEQNRKATAMNGMSASNRGQLSLGGAKGQQYDANGAPRDLRGANFENNPLPMPSLNGMQKPIRGGVGRQPGELGYRDPVQVAQQKSESRLAAERSEAGGGISKAGQYAQAKKDDSIVSNANRYGLKDNPKIAEARQRITDREEIQSDKTLLAAGKGKGGLNKASVDAASFAATPHGKELEKLATSNDGVGMRDRLKKMIPLMDVRERQQAMNWFSLHPGIKQGRLQSHNDALKEIEGLLATTPAKSAEKAMGSVAPEQVPEKTAPPLPSTPSEFGYEHIPQALPSAQKPPGSTTQPRRGKPTGIGNPQMPGRLWGGY